MKVCCEDVRCSVHAIRRQGDKTDRARFADWIGLAGIEGVRVERITTSEAELDMGRSDDNEDKPDEDHSYCSIATKTEWA